MRELLNRILLESILKRKKTGFTPPIAEWLIKEKYSKELEKALIELHNKKIISKEWFDFYKNYVFKNTNLISKNYKVRLFLFYRWWVYWRDTHNI